MDSSQLPIWSDGDIEMCAALIKQNEESFTTLLTELANTDLDKLISIQIVKEKSLRVLYGIF